jgi:ferredoxin
VAVLITDACVTCGACLWECPTEAIAPGDPRPVVDEELCTECFGFFGESQCAVVCPVDAILARPESVEALTAKYHVLYPDRAPQDTWIWRPTGAD